MRYVREQHSDSWTGRTSACLLPAIAPAAPPPPLSSPPPVHVASFSIKKARLCSVLCLSAPSCACRASVRCRLGRVERRCMRRLLTRRCAHIDGDAVRSTTNTETWSEPRDLRLNCKAGRVLPPGPLTDGNFTPSFRPSELLGRSPFLGMALLRAAPSRSQLLPVAASPFARQGRRSLGETGPAQTRPWVSPLVAWLHGRMAAWPHVGWPPPDLRPSDKSSLAARLNTTPEIRRWRFKMRVDHHVKTRRPASNTSLHSPPPGAW